MDIVSIVIISCLSLFAVVGFAAGVVKGYVATKSWAFEYVLCSVLAMAFGALIYNYLGVNGGTDGAIAGIIALALCIGLIILCISLFAGLRKIISSKIEAKEKRSYYEQYEDRQENTEDILDAIYDKDEKEYKRLVKEEKKFKTSRGGWGVFNRIFGGFSLMIKGIVICGLVSAILVMFFDFTRFPSVMSKISGLYDTGIWLFMKSRLMDFFVIALIYMCIKCGYSSGITSAVWAVVVIALVAGAALLAYYFAFKVQAFIDLAAGIALPDSIKGIADSLSSAGVNVTATNISQFLIMLGLFVLFLVVVILISVFVPRAFRNARESAVYCCVDGVLGAIVLTVIMLAVLILGGAALSSIADFEFMEVFSVYFDKSVIANYVYQDNIAVLFGWAHPTLLRSWLGG